MQIVTYNTRNAFLGLGTVTLYLIAYLVQLVFTLFLKVIITIFGEKFIKKKFLMKSLNGLFFNSILSMTMEGYIDLLINGFLNIYTKDTSTNGEIIGFLIAILCVLLTVKFRPISLSWVIFLKNDQ